MQSAIGTLFAILHSQGLFYLVGFVNGRPGSSVGIVTAYVLTVRGSNPGGARFSVPVQTGPEAHQAFCTMGTGSFPGG